LRHVLLATAILALLSTQSAASVNVQKLVANSAHRFGVPVAIALKVAKHESGFNCQARGRAGELGPLQIKLATARGLGYHGSAAALRSCGAGLDWGMKHLALAIRGGGIWKHNQGLYAKRKSAMASAYEKAVMATRIVAVADVRPFDGTSSFRTGTRQR
jgi:hypothetical protein